jgi:ribosomal protein S18 acetylase RimI-like enzyme
MSRVTNDFDEARNAYRISYPDSPFFDTWVPRSKFLEATVDGSGNISISREDDGIYGMGVGVAPVIPSHWKNFSIESRGASSISSEYKSVAEWDCYWAPVRSEGFRSEDSASDGEIKEFLEKHAPQSSVFPGNDEIQRWVVIREESSLVAVAALCKWESGRLVISSVATDSHRRGEGFGKKVMEATLIAGHELGADLLCLGVMHSNVSAQGLYRSMGFRLMHNFTYCERR